jgi:cytoskeletal protein CcmA (bactofilin family)
LYIKKRGDDMKLSILEVEACDRCIEEGPAVVTYCDHEAPAFVASPVPTQGQCRMRDAFIVSSQKKIEGDLRSPDIVIFIKDVEIDGNVYVKDMTGDENITVKGDVFAEDGVDVDGNFTVKGALEAKFCRVGGNFEAKRTNLLLGKNLKVDGEVKINKEVIQHV